MMPVGRKAVLESIEVTRDGDESEHDADDALHAFGHRAIPVRTIPLVEDARCGDARHDGLRHTDAGVVGADVTSENQDKETYRQPGKDITISRPRGAAERAVNRVDDRGAAENTGDGRHDSRGRRQHSAVDPAVWHAMLTRRAVPDASRPLSASIHPPALSWRVLRSENRTSRESRRGSSPPHTTRARSAAGRHEARLRWART